MTFNKKEYWKNREEGKRGQGEAPNPVVAMYQGVGPAKSSKQPTKKAVISNTKRARKGQDNA